VDVVNIGASSIINHKGNSNQEKVPVSVKTLDSSGCNLDHLCFIKIDVEGYEANVLRGAEMTILKHQPLIILEQNKNEFLNGQPEAISWLSDRGYKFCWPIIGSNVKNNYIARKINDLRELYYGRNDTIVTDDVIPQDNYPMLIAVPIRFQHALML